MQTRTTRAIIAIVALVIVAVAGYLILRQSNVQPSQPPPQSDTSEAAAAQSLGVLRQLVTADNYQAMGFNSADEVANAELGQPLKLFRIQLDQLLLYEPESTDQSQIENLLVDVNRVMYPVTVNREVRSSVAVEAIEGKWIGTDFGNPNLIKAMTQFRRGDGDFIVHITFLGLYFVAESTEEGLLFTPITDDPRFDFKAGSSIPASDVVAIILPAARDYNGLPL